jgi:hypothetical protein
MCVPTITTLTFTQKFFASCFLADRRKRNDRRANLPHPNADRLTAPDAMTGATSRPSRNKMYLKKKLFD